MILGMELTLISSTNHDAEVFTAWKHEEQLCVENHAMYKYQTGTIVATQKLSRWRYSYTNKIVLQDVKRFRHAWKALAIWWPLSFINRLLLTGDNHQQLQRLTPDNDNC